MKAKPSEKRLIEYDSVLSLMHRWEALDQQAQGAAQNLRRYEPEVRALLTEVSERIDSGYWHTTGWNIFEILGQVRWEDAHSDALAWLLKPWEAHGLGNRFLLDFVRGGTGKSLPNTRVREVQARKTVGIDGKRIDIQVLGDGWVLAVENKLDYSEALGQTEAYAAHYRRLRQSGTDVYGVFLTIKGESAKAADIFQPMSYRTLRVILDQNRQTTTSEAGQFVRWFAEHIRNDLEAYQ